VELKLNFWRNRPGLPGATKRIDRGKALAEKGQSDDALESFREAAKIDPYEPDAHYQAGMVLCEQQLYLQAVEEYEICESLAPGWFFCRSDMWVARQLALGVMPHEVFLALRFLQDGPPNARKRMEIANRIQFHASTIPLFALLYGNVLQAAGRHREASQLWHRAIEANPEPDVRTRLLVSLSTLEENADKRQGLLEAAADLNGNLIAAAGAVLSLRFGRQARG
jgi:tetratricopeptide (TPR) repeat protein